MKQKFKYTFSHFHFRRHPSPFDFVLFRCFASFLCPTIDLNFFANFQILPVTRWFFFLAQLLFVVVVVLLVNLSCLESDHPCFCDSFPLWFVYLCQCEFGCLIKNRVMIRVIFLCIVLWDCWVATESHTGRQQFNCHIITNDTETSRWPLSCFFWKNKWVWEEVDDFRAHWLTLSNQSNHDK